MRRILVLSFLAVAGAAGGDRPMSFLDVLQFRTVSQGALSRDARKFAYVISSLDWKAGKRFTDVYLTDAASLTSRQLTFTPDKNETAPAFSRDGAWLAFSSDRDGSQQVYLMALAGGEGRKISNIEGGVISFAFSRDGRWIGILGGREDARQITLYELSSGETVVLPKHATGLIDWAWAPDSGKIYFTAPDNEDPAEQKRKELKFDVRLVDPPRSPRHLWFVEVEGKREKRLTSGSEFSVERFTVSRDGRFLGFTGNSTERYADPRRSEAYLLESATGNLERLTTNSVPESAPLISPSGEWVAFSAAEQFTPYRRNRVYLRPTRGGSWKILGGDWDGEVRGFSWSSDSRRLYFSEGMGVTQELYELGLSGEEPVRMTRGEGQVSASYDADAGRFVLLYDSPAQPRDYYLASPADTGNRNQWRRLSEANPQARDFALGEYETVRWKSTDGTMIEGLLVKPVGYEAGKRYPLIVQLHGGPAGAYIRGFSASHGTYTHVFASGGYAVFQPNYRGSSNYGEKFRMQIAGDYFRQAFDDIMTGVDDLIRRGIADPDKLGMMGWSAGGHWSNWTLTHTDRFKAISSGAGAVNWISMYAETDTQSTREFYFRGKPYDNWDHYVAVSPLRYIRNAKTPTLIHVGHDDQRVPRPQSEELHMALKKLGVPTEFIVYPRMGHGITEPRYQLVKMVSEYNWFEKWIRGKKDWFNWNELLDTLPKESPMTLRATTSDENGRERE